MELGIDGKMKENYKKLMSKLFSFKHISIKIGFYFLISTLLIEALLFFLLYFSLVNTRVDEEVDALLARGNSHRDVLQNNFDPETISHVALMESEAKTRVVITTETGKILAKSANVDKAMEKHLKNTMEHVPTNGTVIEKHWRSSNYICTVSPIKIQGKNKGFVYMFLGTDSIRTLIDHLTDQFIIIGAITFFLTVITVFLLSKILTIPLVYMKKATKKMSKGDLSVSLNIRRKDEIGELADSILQLAHDLDYIKKERGEFLASVAHELRTPLTYVKGYADIALRNNLSLEERHKYLSIIKEETEHLTNLVEDLFELAQMEHHNFIIDKQETNLSEFLNNVVKKIQPAYIDKNIRIVWSCPQSLTLALDTQRFEQVMINLCNNAYRHSYKDSEINIRVNKEINNVKISISDQGEGIPEKDIPYIFERFYRVDKSRTRSSGGSGLGLSIVKEIVELHGGTVTIESKPNDDTTVNIKIPIH